MSTNGLIMFILILIICPICARRVVYAFSEGRFPLFIPTGASFIIFVLDIANGSPYFFMYLFVFEILYVFSMSIYERENPIEAIIWAIIIPVAVGIVTIGILDIFDFGGMEDIGDLGDTGDGQPEGNNGEIGSTAGNGIDLDGDGEIEGFDVDGDGEIEHNIVGVEVPDTESVDGYVTDEGTKVGAYVRTEPDSTTLNNLDPE